MVMLRLDYCNALLAGLPQATVAPLQLSRSFDLRAQHLRVRLLQLRWLYICFTPSCIGWMFLSASSLSSE